MKPSFPSPILFFVGGVMLVLVILWWFSFRRLVSEEMHAGSFSAETSMVQQATRDIQQSFSGVQETFTAARALLNEAMTPPLSPSELQSIESALRNAHDNKE